MNKIAILPLKEMPSSCSECEFHTKGYRVRGCQLTKDVVETVRWKWNSLIHPNCPLISIDIDELEEALKRIKNNVIDYKITYEYEQQVQDFNTLKSATSKLGGKQ